MLGSCVDGPSPQHFAKGASGGSIRIQPNSKDS